MVACKVAERMGVREEELEPARLLKFAVQKRSQGN